MDPSYSPQVYRDLGGDRMTVGPRGILNIEGRVTGLMPTTDYFVDSALGSVDNDGLSWATALLTISAAMLLAAALGTRGRARIFVAPGGYVEDIKTPLNDDCPFGQLIAVNPTPGSSFGAVWVTAATPGVECLQVRARGWYISGFEFDALADAECVVLGEGVGCNAGGTIIEDCLFVGQNQGLYGIDFANELASNPHVTIRRCGFYGFHSGSTDGKCITCTNSSHDQPRFVMIEDCWFGDSDNLIDMVAQGFKESTIRRCTFYANGSYYNPDEKLNNGGGRDTYIYDNIFGGTYDHGGGYVAGTNDVWSNLMAGGRTAANPAV